MSLVMCSVHSLCSSARWPPSSILVGMNTVLGSPSAPGGGQRLGLQEQRQPFRRRCPPALCTSSCKARRFWSSHSLPPLVSSSACALSVSRLSLHVCVAVTLRDLVCQWLLCHTSPKQPFPHQLLKQTQAHAPTGTIGTASSTRSSR